MVSLPSKRPPGSWSLPTILVSKLPPGLPVLPALSVQLMPDCFPPQYSQLLCSSPGPRQRLQQIRHLQSTPQSPPSLQEKVTLSPKPGPLSQPQALGGPSEPPTAWFSCPLPALHTLLPFSARSNLCRHFMEKVEFTELVFSGFCLPPV